MELLGSSERSQWGDGETGQSASGRRAASRIPCRSWRLAHGRGRAPGHAETLVESQVEFEHVHPWVADETKRCRFCELSDHLIHLVDRYPAGLGDTSGLYLGRRGTDVRVQTAGGCGHHVGRNRSLVIGILLPDLID